MAKKIDKIFESLKNLKEETFNVSDEVGREDLISFEREEEVEKPVEVINPDAETEEDLEDFEDSFYLNKLIAVCNVCENPSFLVKEDISNVFNCPYCYTEGATFDIVGKVVSEDEEDIETEEESIEVKDKEDLEESKKTKKVKPLKESRGTRRWKKKGYTLEIDDDYDYGHDRFREIMNNYGGEWTDSGFTVPSRTNFEDVEIGDYIIGSYGDDIEYYQVKESDIVEDEYEGERFGRDYNAYIVKSTGGTERQLKSIVDEINYDSKTNYISAELTDLDGETIDALSGIHSANRDASTLSLEETLEILEDFGFDFGEAEQAFFGGSIKESKKTKKVKPLRESKKLKEDISYEDLGTIEEIALKIFKDLDKRNFDGGPSNRASKLLRQNLESSGFEDDELEDAIQAAELKWEEWSLNGLEESKKILFKNSDRLAEELKLTIGIDEYKPWAGAVDTWDKIQNADMVADLEDFLEDIYPNGLTTTQLNDILWFDGEDILETLGLADEEDYEDLDESKELKENKELVDGKADFVGRPHRYKDLERFKKELLDNPSRLHEYKIVKSITKDIKTFADIDEIIEETKFIGGSIVDGDNITDIVKALEIKSTDGTYLVDPSGYDYARYLAFKPVEKLMREDLDTTLTKAQIKRLYDIFEFEEDEEIERAYIENGQLKIDYDSPKGGNIYEPDLSGKEGKEKLNFILTGKELKENKSKKRTSRRLREQLKVEKTKGIKYISDGKLKEDEKYYTITIFKDKNKIGSSLLIDGAKDSFDEVYFKTVEEAKSFADKNYPEEELIIIRENTFSRGLKTSHTSGPHTKRDNGEWKAYGRLKEDFEDDHLGKSSRRKFKKSIKEEFSKTRKFKDGGITYTVSLYEDPSGYVAKWEDDSDNGLGYNNYGYISYKYGKYYINAVNRPIKKESIKNRIIKIVASLREEEALKESKDSDFEIDNAVGQPFDKVSKHLTDNGFKLAQYGNVRHNDPTKAFAVFKDKNNEITLYYDMVKQGDRDSYKAGEVFDFDIGTSSSINGIKEATTIQIKGDADIEVDSEDKVKVDVEGAIPGQIIEPLTDEEQEEVIELQDITDELDDAYHFEDKNMSKLVTNFLKENFSDVRNYKVNKIRNTKQGLVVEGTIAYRNRGTRKTVFTFENFNKNSSRLKIKGDSDIFGSAKGFVLEGTIRNKRVTPTSLRYDFKQTFEGVAYKVFGRALLD